MANFKKDVPNLHVTWVELSCKAIPIGNHVFGPLPASFFGKCEISEIHGENARIKFLK